MGKRATGTLREIEEIRSKLGRNLDELDARYPVGGVGRKVGAVGGVLVSSGLLGSLWAFVVGKFFRRSEDTGKKTKRRAEPEPQPVVVTVAPRGAAAVAVLGIAVWAGVRLYETYTRTQGDERGFRPSVVKMPTSEPRSSSS